MDDLGPEPWAMTPWTTTARRRLTDDDLDDDALGETTRPLPADERESVEADLQDLSGMRVVFESQGAKGVVINCTDCGMNHYFGWELLQESLEHMLQTGEPRMHEPAFAPNEEDYIAWDYAKGYLDALADAGLGPEFALRRPRVPVVQHPARARLRVLPAVRPAARGGAPVRRAGRARPRRTRGAGHATAPGSSRRRSFFAARLPSARLLHRGFFAVRFFAARLLAGAAMPHSSSSSAASRACGSSDGVLRQLVDPDALERRRAHLARRAVICRYSTSHDQLGPHPARALHLRSARGRRSAARRPPGRCSRVMRSSIIWSVNPRADLPDPAELAVDVGAHQQRAERVPRPPWPGVHPSTTQSWRFRNLTFCQSLERRPGRYCCSALGDDALELQLARLLRERDPVLFDAEHPPHPLPSTTTSASPARRSESGRPTRLSPSSHSRSNAYSSTGICFAARSISGPRGQVHPLLEPLERRAPVRRWRRSRRRPRALMATRRAVQIVQVRVRVRLSRPVREIRRIVCRSQLQQRPDAVELRLEPPARAVERLVPGLGQHRREHRRPLGRPDVGGLRQEDEPVALRS